jgi:hypothetical protein
MSELAQLVPALGTDGSGGLHGWWLLLAIVVATFILPVAFFVARQHRDQLRRH